MNEEIPKRLHVDERRAQLLKLGVELFSERSYDDVSVDDIANAAGVSKGLLYHYFGGKRDFYIAVVKASAELLLDISVPDQTLDLSRRLERTLNTYLDFVEQREGAYISLMRSGIGNDTEVASIVENTRAVFVRRALARGGLDESNSVFRLAARSWLGQVEAACLDWLSHGDISRQELVTLLSSSLQGTMHAERNLGESQLSVQSVGAPLPASERLTIQTLPHVR